jgi:2-hydroxy-3-oxopropionate reductase
MQPYGSAVLSQRSLISEQSRSNLENEVVMEIGFIGLGQMGLPMAINLVKGGHTVRVISRSRPPVDEALRHGALEARDFAELGGSSEVVILMLPTPSVTEAVALGPQGVIEAMGRGTTLVDMGTESPGLAHRLHQAGQPREIDVLDAPVSGGDVGAREGTLSIMVGGDAKVFERIRPAFEAMGREINLVGGVGAGQSVKAVNQVLVGGALATVAEALVLLERADVDIESALRALGGGRGGSAILTAKAAQMLERQYQPGFRVELHTKDLEIVREFARSLGVSIPLTAYVLECFRSVENSGGASLDHSAIIEVARGLQSLGLPDNSGS